MTTTSSTLPPAGVWPRGPAAILSWPRRALAAHVAEIEADGVLRAYGAVLVLTHLLTAVFWWHEDAGSMLHRAAEPICWGLVPGCAALRAFTDLGAMIGLGRRRAEDPVAAIETPVSWFVGGQVIGLVGLVWLGHHTFGMPYWQTALAVLLSFVLALVACRVTGETDTTPVGAMGKITQLTFGVVSPGNMNVNLMSANVTA